MQKTQNPLNPDRRDNHIERCSPNTLRPFRLLASAICHCLLAINRTTASVLSLFLVALLIGPASVRPSLAADAPKDGNWDSLFNGKDLNGWVPVHDVTFVVTNSNLRLVTGMGWLRTEKQYTDFVLEAEWRALGQDYDSGFFIRAGAEGKPWPKDGWQVNLARGALGALVKGYKTVVPAETPPMPVNKWVKFRIEVRGRTVTLDVDGERAWEYKELDADRGYIGIQAENKAFDFRSLRVQELPKP
jgi:hypothetical protein